MFVRIISICFWRWSRISWKSKYSILYCNICTKFAIIWFIVVAIILPDIPDEIGSWNYIILLLCLNFKSCTSIYFNNLIWVDGLYFQTDWGTWESKRRACPKSSVCLGTLFENCCCSPRGGGQEFELLFAGACVIC